MSLDELVPDLRTLVANLVFVTRVQIERPSNGGGVTQPDGSVVPDPPRLIAVADMLIRPVGPRETPVDFNGQPITSGAYYALMPESVPPVQYLDVFTVMEPDVGSVAPDSQLRDAVFIAQSPGASSSLMVARQVTLVRRTVRPT